MTTPQVFNSEHAANLPASGPASASSCGPSIASPQRQGYRIGSLALTVGFDEAVELAQARDIARLPNAPAWVLGLANVHGRPVPVFDLCPALGLTHDAAKLPMWLVIGTGDCIAAIVVDGTPLRLRLQPDARTTDVIDAGALTPYVRAQWHDTHGTKWLEVDLPALLEALVDHDAITIKPPR